MDESDQLAALTQAYLLRVYRRPLVKEQLSASSTGPRDEEVLRKELQGLVVSSIGDALASLRRPDQDLDTSATQSTVAALEDTSTSVVTMSPMIAMTSTMSQSTSLAGPSQKSSPKAQARGNSSPRQNSQGSARSPRQNSQGSARSSRQNSQGFASNSSTCQRASPKSSKSPVPDIVGSKTSVQSTSTSKEGQLSAKNNSKSPPKSPSQSKKRKAPPEIEVGLEPASPRNRSGSSKKVDAQTEQSSPSRKHVGPPRKGASDQGKPSSPKAPAVPDACEALPTTSENVCQNGAVATEAKTAQSLGAQSTSPQGESQSLSTSSSLQSLHRKHDETPTTVGTGICSVAETPDTLEEGAATNLWFDVPPRWSPQLHTPQPFQPSVPDHLDQDVEDGVVVPKRPREARKQANPRKRPPAPCEMNNRLNKKAATSAEGSRTMRTLPKLEPEDKPKGAKLRSRTAEPAKREGPLHPHKDPSILSARDQALLRRKFEENLHGVKDTEERVGHMKQQLQSYHFSLAKKAQAKRDADLQKQWEHRRYERIKKSDRDPKEVEVDYEAYQYHLAEQEAKASVKAEYEALRRSMTYEASAKPTTDGQMEQNGMWGNSSNAAMDEVAAVDNKTSNVTGGEIAGMRPKMPLSDPCCRSARSGLRKPEPFCRVAWRKRYDARTQLTPLPGEPDSIVPVVDTAKSLRAFGLPRLPLPPRVPPSVCVTMLAKRIL